MKETVLSFYNSPMGQSNEEIKVSKRHWTDLFINWLCCRVEVQEDDLEQKYWCMIRRTENERHLQMRRLKKETIRLAVMAKKQVSLVHAQRKNHKKLDKLEKQMSESLSKINIIEAGLLRSMTERVMVLSAHNPPKIPIV